MRNAMAAGTIASDLATTIQLLVELDLDGVPIAGTVQRKPHGHRTSFNGWLQLTEAIGRSGAQRLLLSSYRRYTTHRPTGEQETMTMHDCRLSRAQSA